MEWICVKKFQGVILTTIISSFVSNVFLISFAKDNDKFIESQVEIKYICEEVRSMDIGEEEVHELVIQGLTKSDAEYYIRLDKIVSLLEQENIEVKLDEDIEDISDREFFNNQSYYREKILQGDKVALKKALKSVDNIINGSEYTEKIISAFSDKASYEIIYPDGSRIFYNTKVKESEKKALIERQQQKGLKSKISENADNIGNNNDYKGKHPIYKPVKLGYEETIMDQGVTFAYENLGSRDGEWSFESGLSFSKVYLYTEFQLSDNGVSTIKYARGGQSSYGIVNIANSTGAVISRTTSEGSDMPAEARNEVIFTVSGSFGASFLILSLSVEPGMNWTQYIIFRLYEPRKIEEYYGAEYKWYAAEFK